MHYEKKLKPETEKELPGEIKMNPEKFEIIYDRVFQMHFPFISFVI